MVNTQNNEDDESSHCDAQTTVQQAQPNCCNIFSAFFQLCGLCCYVGCPPFPENIARKLAFHPPKKGVSYSVHCVEQPDKEIHGADEGNCFRPGKAPFTSGTLIEHHRYAHSLAPARADDMRRYSDTADKGIVIRPIRNSTESE
ncbi:hypothetical protein Y032_0134g1833 [Ancylostoma ceylanicum]|uniref:Uncharacterized protein n=1 Tax=Ancylostoma ceylanicum TaxID=53326 RepID=A0A016T5Y4_9BILA|nr:hypothetical protein Y032_0134g1833 [Ancylostoma ceylanicum]